MPPKTYLVDTHPDIHAELHPTRNSDLDVASLGTFSNKKVWFLHEDNRGDLHEWAQVVRNRTYDGTGCQECAAAGARKRHAFRTPLPGKSLGDALPDIAETWHPTRNGVLTPYDVLPYSSRRVWWLCPEGHEFTAECGQRSTIYARCPGCRVRVGPCRSHSAATLAEAYPQVAAQWHPTRNAGLAFAPETVGYASNEKVWWVCTEGHSWRAHIHLRTTGGSGCDRCARRAHRERGSRWGRTGTLAERFPNIAAQWHPTRNGDLTPDLVRSCAYAAYWWQCPQGHEWEQSVTHRVRRGDKPACWACSRPVKTTEADFSGPGQDTLADVAPRIAAWWHPSRNGHLKPDQVRPHAACVVWWKCDEGHAFRATPASRYVNMTGCRRCSNKAERNSRPDVREKRAA